jgi:uncharacterized protein (TIGR03663 family)
MTRSLTLVLLLATGAALALRAPDLNRRPMHNDEAVNAIKFGQLWNHQGYKYDPNEHHGPSLIYATLALERLTAAPDLDHYTDARLRVVTVIFGLGLMLLLPLLLDALGKQGTTWAAVFTAASPALVFYSRYYIHEILLVFFTFLTLAAAWRYWRSRRIGWVLLAGAALGLMASTKETFVITVFAAALALGLNQVWNQVLDASEAPTKAARVNVLHLAAALGISLVVALLLFSSFFTNLNGPLDSIRTYLPWVHRASGDSPHIHPWYFYLQRLLFFHVANGPVWTEATVLVLAILATVAGFKRKNLAGANASFVRFLSLYVFLLTAFYSLLAYKTPWCLLSFWHAAVLLAGVGAAVIIRAAKSSTLKFAAAVLLVIGSVHLAWQAWRVNTTYASDPRNPYVYAQTSSDIIRLTTQTEDLASADPRGHNLILKIIAPDGDYWPLPWYLRRFKQSGWWDHMPEDPFAPIVIVSAKLQAALDEKKTHLMVGYFQLRPQNFLELYVQTNLWQEWLEHRRKRGVVNSD